MRLALLILTLTVCWTANAQSTIANGTLNYALLNQSSLINGLVSYWKLDEAGTGTRYDSWGKNDLTAVNSPSYAAGKVGNAATFVRSSNQYLSVANNSSLQMGSGVSYTITCWVNFTTLVNNTGIVGKWANTGTDNEFVVLYLSGKFSFFTTNGGFIASGYSPIATNTWYFIACWNDLTNRYISINDNAAASNACSYTPVFSNNLNIGAYGYDTNTCLNGLVDEVGIWKRVLSAAERTALYKSGTGCTYPSFSRRSQSIDFDWDNWQPLQLPEQIPVAYLNRKPTLISLCE